MTLTIELPQDLELELSDEAEKLGMSLPEYTVRLLYSRQTSKETPTTGAELVAYWKRVRLIGTRKDIFDSQEYARQLRTV